MREPVQRVAKPWGHELLIAHTESYVGKILVIEPGEALSLQLHRVKDETFHVVRGEIELVVEEEGVLVAQPLRPGESYRVPAGTRHRMIAGPEGCELFEVSTPHLEDVVRLEDRYGRS
ncbi:MAG: cupin domain-containing protein [Acidobacteria bacterium]|jgi:mannose-6-phosphate isomerase-like protein (cupin superfamily)|nr:cupin domain-containing protein [Thermoanaerobaculia bacterium]MDI9630765.1 cupin domain-containing protein [Acidobacteriota bacterium]OQC41433.1 MAG: Mannose-1-phosphate guanylyltransferase 1 [Acidobacteria bacterium ADurb.Bin051]MBP7813967.1 cupin domain-containing protein [Thermoanaerobaculia bacterium]NLN10638.1 cupin domain-containing protein [Acidobacteriota bacterium]